jgi:hypothetical protein
MNDSTDTIGWVVLALLAVAALILLVPVRNLPETYLSARIILATLLLAICGALAIRHKVS